MADGIIKTNGMELTVLDDRQAIVIEFTSRDHEPVKVSMPLAIANKLADFIKEKLIASAQQDEADEVEAHKLH